MASVIILGGGFGGLAAAHELRQQLGPEHEVTLIGDSDRFFVGYAKLWDLVGARPLEQGTGRLSGLEEQGVRFVHAQVIAIDPERRAVETTAGRFDGDYMIVALGCARGRQKLGSADHGAYDLYDAGRLPAMRAELQRLERGRVIVAVLGAPYVCPPAPYEAAFLIDEHLRQRGVRDSVEVLVTTPRPSPLPMAGSEVEEAVADRLASQGIELRTGQEVAEIDAKANAVSFGDGFEIEYSLLLGVPPAVAPAVLADSPLAGEGGWVYPDRETGRTAFERVYAVGDCTSVENLPKAGVFAEALGRVAAANVAAEIDGGQQARYDGAGYCFLEFNGQRAAAVEGEFFAKPKPRLWMAEPDAETFARKQRFEAERLQTWLGAHAPTAPAS